MSVLYLSIKNVILQPVPHLYHQHNYILFYLKMALFWEKEKYTLKIEGNISVITKTTFLSR